MVLTALRHGAAGFLLKDTPPAELVAAVRRTAAGEPMLSPSVTAQLIAAVTVAAGRHPSARRPPAARPADRPGARGRRRGRPGAQQHRDRRRAAPGRGDGQDARRPAVQPSSTRRTGSRSPAASTTPTCPERQQMKGASARCAGSALRGAGAAGAEDLDRVADVGEAVLRRRPCSAHFSTSGPSTSTRGRTRGRPGGGGARRSGSGGRRPRRRRCAGRRPGRRRRAPAGAGRRWSGRPRRRRGAAASCSSWALRKPSTPVERLGDGGALTGGAQAGQPSGLASSGAAPALSAGRPALRRRRTSAPTAAARANRPARRRR